jgi:hypothetical protein
LPGLSTYTVSLGLAACLSKEVATIDRANEIDAGARRRSNRFSLEKPVIAAAESARKRDHAAPRNRGSI